MIYIASPYTHHNLDVMTSRYEAVLHYAGRLKSAGIPCFSPIAYGHEFFIRGYTPPYFTFWQSFNDHMILASSEVVVLTLPGYNESVGVQHEIEFARKNNMPVRFVANEDF
jgi:hypothetical protein